MGPKVCGCSTRKIIFCYEIYIFIRYTRNLVDSGNGKFNLMALCWNEQQGSSIHDHSNSHCFVKVLDGELREVMFKWPEKDNEENCEMKQGDGNTYQRDQVTYINGKNTQYIDL